MKALKDIYLIALRECGNIRRNPIYAFCMIFFPIIVVIFFTSLMGEGVPANMPVGVVDLDNTTTSRALVRQLDGLQSSQVVQSYENVNEARRDIQKDNIFAFLYIPKGMTKDIERGEQGKISYYYNAQFLLAGNLTFRDLKVVTQLGTASVGITKLAALGKSNEEIAANLQPVAIDLHMVGNPWTNYNVYLSSFIVPGVLLLFVFLITPYSIGTELKFKRSREWIVMAHDNIYVALAGKMLPQTLIFLSIFYCFEFYIYYVLGFPHPGGVGRMLLIGFLSVISCQSFGIFSFGLMPALRLSMSICSLWSVLSFSVGGATFPLESMDPEIQAFAQMFPLRHYYVIYHTCIFNDFSLSYVFGNILALCCFAILPLLTNWNLKRAMLHDIYIP
ncbi:MAG: ABC transporter permease [Prevotella sp.]|uniref:ABC transporter permease n=1 Tax=Segatella cerevisiae TaxID=2053716 RepID=A0ABT1C0Q7_9BACT|nr:ABC transporter permease [Segatella cerevisiae]MCH3994177.1 ABC transporter permease [Prevotella sp.]MCI1247138.1 ABC transporter permease [Prevotella sp.]MCO6026188.1 ABC transporter permease [Segatella cerevisiae]